MRAEVYMRGREGVEMREYEFRAVARKWREISAYRSAGHTAFLLVRTASVTKKRNS